MLGFVLGTQRIQVDLRALEGSNVSHLSSPSGLGYFCLYETSRQHFKNCDNLGICKGTHPWSVHLHLLECGLQYQRGLLNVSLLRTLHGLVIQRVSRDIYNIQLD